LFLSSLLTFAPAAGRPAGADVVSFPSAEAIEADQAEAATQAKADGRPVAEYLWSTQRLLGEFDGHRQALEDRGLIVQLYYNNFLGVKSNGGRTSSAAARNSGSADLFLYADFEELFGLGGGEGLLQVKGQYGRNINPLVDALSDPIDDADGDAFYVSQLWLQQSVADERVAIRLGYLDQQVAIDRNAYANSEDRQFMSTFLDNNPLVPLAIGVGATAFITPTNWLEIILSTADADAKRFSAGFDTAFDNFTSLFGYFEVGASASVTSARGPLYGKYRVGVVYDPRVRAVFRDESEHRCQDLGVYFNFDQMVYREAAGSSQGLGVFGRYGYRDPEINAITHFWSAGLHYEGAVAGRGEDVIGFGVYSARMSDDFRRAEGRDFRYETGYELYYRIQALPWLTITPDVQFISNPGGLTTVEDTVVFALRGRVTF
jgi:porin